MPKPPKKSAPSRKHTAAPRKSGSSGRTQEKAALPKFGQFLQQRRQSLDLEQSTICAAIGSSQSLVSQLEAGMLSNPSKELFEKLASAYYLTKEELVGAFVREKLGIDPAKTSLLRTDAFDFRQLVRWEETVDAGEIWVVARKIVDAEKSNKGTDMRNAVMAQLKRGTTYRFFLPDTEIKSGGYHKLRLLLREKLRDVPSWESKLHGHRLSEEEERWITASMVIANPQLLVASSEPNTGRQAVGFTIFSPCLMSRPERNGYDGDTSDDDKECIYAFRMDADELRLNVDHLDRWLNPPKVNDADGGQGARVSPIDTRRHGQGG